MIPQSSDPYIFFSFFLKKKGKQNLYQNHARKSATRVESAHLVLLLLHALLQLLALPLGLCLQLAQSLSLLTA